VKTIDKGIRALSFKPFQIDYFNACSFKPLFMPPLMMDRN